LANTYKGLHQAFCKMFNLFRKPEPKTQDLSYVVMRLTNDPGVIDNYRRAGAAMQSMGYNVVVSTPTMTAADSERFMYGVEVEVKESPQIAGKLLRDMEDMTGESQFYGFDWGMYYPLTDMSDDPDFRGFSWQDYNHLEEANREYEEMLRRDEFWNYDPMEDMGDFWTMRKDPLEELKDRVVEGLRRYIRLYYAMYGNDTWDY